MATPLYDKIGVDYATYRRPDPRIAGYIDAALASAASVVNVGAGAGSYEPSRCRVVAVEPSQRMIDQRRNDSAVVRAYADHLPFADASFDGSLAILTIHHWPDWRVGLREMCRVSRRRVVILTHDSAPAPFWLTRDYFPEITAMDERRMPSADEIGEVLGPCTVTPVLVPHDCTDGFLGAYWRRPKAYLDPGARRAISGFAMLAAAPPGLARLASDLTDGTWHERNREVLGLDELDIGYRLIVAGV